MTDNVLLGQAMHSLMAELFPICRSLTGDGVRQTLARLSDIVPYEVHEVPSGTQAFDWTVPDEWNIRDAYVMDQAGNRVIDFQANNLHVVGYSVPFSGVLTREELLPHLHTRADLPEAIPYLTSYYSCQWGFCLSHQQLEALGPGPFQVKIDSTLAPGSLTYADLLIPGDSEQEILLSSYCCHPSMANNELSGPVLTTFLAKSIMERPRRRYSYRIVIVPETIGAITYISRHLQALKNNVVAGYVLTCVGGPSGPTYSLSRQGNSLADRAALNTLAHCGEDYRVLPWIERASDERQYGAPGVDLPVGSLMRSRYFDFPEYHTSLDDLSYVTPAQMVASFALYNEIVNVLEANRVWEITSLCEPQLGKRGLYPSLGGQHDINKQMFVMNALIGYCDGSRDMIAMADLHGRPVRDFIETVALLSENGLICERGE